MGKFLVRWGTFQGGPNIVMITGNRLFWFNLPPTLAAWLNQPSAVNAIANLDLGPNGHFALTYRVENGSLKQLRSPGLEDWLGVPRLPLTTELCFTFGLPQGVIAVYRDSYTGAKIWVARDLVKDMTDFMTQHGLAFNANIQEFELGYNGTWALITGTMSGYDSPGPIEDLIRSTGNVLHGGFSFNKMTNDQFYLETPAPHLRASTAWLGTLGQAINDAPVSSLFRGYYDENSHVVVLPGQLLAARLSGTTNYFSAGSSPTGSPGYAKPSATANYFSLDNFSTGSPGHVLPAKPSATGGYLNSDNFSTGLNIISNSMQVAANVTGSTAATTAGCYMIL